MEDSNLSLKYTCETIQVLESMHIWKATKYLEDIILQKDVFHRQSIVELKDSKAKISAEFWLHKLKHVESDAESQYFDVHFVVIEYILSTRSPKYADIYGAPKWINL